MKPTPKPSARDDAFRDRLARGIRSGPLAAGSRPERRAKRYGLIEGETLSGTVAKLPTPNSAYGTWLVLDCDGRCLALAATAKRGWSVLERALIEQLVGVGDRIELRFCGWRESREGRRYRLVRVAVLARARAEELAA
jgi:hypothetical protein